MRWKQVGAIITCMAVLLSGCDDKKDTNNKNVDTETTETKVINEGDYAALLPLQVSDARSKQAHLNSNLMDTFVIGEGLMSLSKAHFSPDTYSYRENQFLTYSALTDTNSGLLGSNSESNPVGLNLAADAKIKTDHGDLTSPILVLTIIEYDWYKDGELSGLSLALVVRSSITDSATNIKYVINEDQFDTFVKEAGWNVVKYLRDTHPEIGEKMPIYLSVFDANNKTDGLPGVFMMDAYSTSKTNASYESISDEWYMFPTEASQAKDSSVHTDFVNYKNALSQLNLSDDTSIIGKGHYQDGKLTKLTIDVTAHAKTGAEINAVIQVLNDNLSAFTSTDYQIIVDITCDNTHVAMINRAKGSSKTTTISLVN